MSVTDLRPTDEASMLPGTDLPPTGVPGYADVWPTPRQGPMVQVRRLARRSALVGGVLLASLLLALLFGPAAAIVPVVLVLGAWGLFVVPFGVVAPVVVGFLLSISNPSLNPAENKWRSPLLPIGKALFTIMPIKLAPADVLVGVLVIRALMIVVLGNWGAGIDRRPTRQFAQAALAGIAAISIWTVYGLATGGSFKNMLWQVRPLMWLPCFALAASVAAATRSGIARFRTAVLIAGLVKAAEGIWFFFLVAKPQRLDVAFVTTHSDSVLWSLAVSIVIAEWIEVRTRRTRRNLLLLTPIYALAMVLNNRRTVWVSVFASAFFLVMVAQRPVQRQLARILGLVWPLVLVYVAVGLGSHSASIAFKPVSMVDSVLFQTDSSSSTRDIENYNLMVTIRARPFVGWGFGHEYIEAIRADDIAKQFAQYRYIPHNSFLGLWAFIGPIGASGYFLLPVVAVFYAVSARRRSRDPTLRAPGAWAVCAVIAYLVQGWADIGLQDWTAILCVGIGFGIAGALPRHVANEERIALGGSRSDSRLASLG